MTYPFLNPSCKPRDQNSLEAFWPIEQQIKLIFIFYESGGHEAG